MKIIYIFEYNKYLMYSVCFKNIIIVSYISNYSVLKVPVNRYKHRARYKGFLSSSMYTIVLICNCNTMSLK